MMKRKLWFNVTPGKDLVADLMFHFPQVMKNTSSSNPKASDFFLTDVFRALAVPFKQELSKYLRGYHNCTKLDMTDLGGLLFRALVDSDRTRFDEIPKLLGDLVPADQIKIMTADDWKTVKGRWIKMQKIHPIGQTWTVSSVHLTILFFPPLILQHIIYSYNQQSGITVQEAKTMFLETIATWPTFGCTFFDVKVSQQDQKRYSYKWLYAAGDSVHMPHCSKHSSPVGQTKCGSSSTSKASASWTQRQRYDGWHLFLSLTSSDSSSRLSDIAGHEGHASVQPHRRVPPQTALLPHEDQHGGERQQLCLWEFERKWLRSPRSSEWNRYTRSHSPHEIWLLFASPIRANK